MTTSEGTHTFKVTSQCKTCVICYRIPHMTNVGGTDRAEVLIHLLLRKKKVRVEGAVKYRILWYSCTQGVRSRDHSSPGVTDPPAGPGGKGLQTQLLRTKQEDPKFHTSLCYVARLYLRIEWQGDVCACVCLCRRREEEGLTTEPHSWVLDRCVYSPALYTLPSDCSCGGTRSCACVGADIGEIYLCLLCSKMQSL